MGETGIEPTTLALESKRYTTVPLMLLQIQVKYKIQTEVYLDYFYKEKIAENL
jgi:hypothetical protein